MKLGEKLNESAQSSHCPIVVAQTVLTLSEQWISFHCVIHAWRFQDLAQFARCAHVRLGRGFVLIESDAPKPIYVTRILEAPPQLVALSTTTRRRMASRYVDGSVP